MPAKHIACGPFQTRSEEDAIEYLKARLSQDWILLSNVQHSAKPNRAPDEIDIVAIGPPGLFPIEVKHWDSAFLKQNRAVVECEADKQEMKVRRLAGRLGIGKYLHNRFLLTLGDPGESVRDGIKGAQFFGLKAWRELLEVEGPKVLERNQVAHLAQELEPRTTIALGKDVRTFGPYTNLELQSLKGDLFRRVYRGVNASTRDRIILFRYDVSALESRSALRFAQRECDIIRKLQKLDCVPTLHDSFQPASEYPGEIYFWSLIDPGAPTIAEVARKMTAEQWASAARVAFIVDTMRALNAVHHAETASDSHLNLHRNLSPTSIRRRSTNKPLFTDFLFAQISGAETIASVWKPSEAVRAFTAPEVIEGGLSFATEASDVYALCASLLVVLENAPGSEAELARAVLRLGLNDRNRRPKLTQLIADLDAITSPAKAESERDTDSIPGRYWDEDVSPRLLNNHRYKIISRLGAGGIGITFKVVHLGKDTDEELGTYVAKVVEKIENAQVCLEAYQRVRSFTLTTPHLAKLCETADSAAPDRIAALLEWIDGTPLSEVAGYTSIYAEEHSALDPDSLALRWIEQMCNALSVLHKGQLVHGDVSPKNIIIRGTDAFLTDYDTVTPCGRQSRSGGTPDYASSNAFSYHPLRAADDLFALSATFFHALFEYPPFRYGEILSRDRGPNWQGVDRSIFPLASQFVERGLSQNPFESASEALLFLDELRGHPSDTTRMEKQGERPIWGEHREPWLTELLRSYPGAKHGNRETRGLDSDYALHTYVPTKLDDSLYERIRDRSVSLVVLCGNAGDGKTAFLQHLASRLGIGRKSSAQRIWDETLEDGLRIYANLDGSAAYEERTARELLDETFKPFLSCTPPQNRIHLLAINSGPLLSWIEETDSALAEHLGSALDGDFGGLPEWLSFVDLNSRSLVGGRDQQNRLSTAFLDELLQKMLGSASSWQNCPTCTAQNRCAAWSSAQAIRDPDQGDLLKHRMFRALQAVHARGEIHPTAREIRAALTYVLFDVHECVDLHENPGLTPWSLSDRAFDPTSPYRQGEILGELTRLDPALESHPKIDRELRRRFPEQPLGSARRRAYFEWSDNEIERIGGMKSALGLARSQHLQRFLAVPEMDNEERAALCRELCLGIARLEELPPVAFNLCPDEVPLRIVPRTPTESEFWVSKPLRRFRLEAELPDVREPLESLHNALVLSYCYHDGPRTEVLRINSELFHLLIELKEGFQLSDTLSDDTFAHLSVFTQRLVQENELSMLCWNPMDDKTVYEFVIQQENGSQKMILTPLQREIMDA
jgi:serine/threonine protein kinase